MPSLQIADHQFQTLPLFFAKVNGSLQHTPSLLANLYPSLYVGQHILIIVASETHPSTQCAMTVRQLFETFPQSSLYQLAIHLKPNVQLPHLFTSNQSHQQQSLQRTLPSSSFLKFPQQPLALFVLSQSIIIDQFSLKHTQFPLQLCNTVVIRQILHEMLGSCQKFRHSFGIQLSYHCVNGINADAGQLGKLHLSHKTIVAQTLCYLTLQSKVPVQLIQRLKLRVFWPFIQHFMYSGKGESAIYGVAIIVEVAHDHLHSHFSLSYKILHCAKILLCFGQVTPNYSSFPFLQRDRFGF